MNYKGIVVRDAYSLQFHYTTHTMVAQAVCFNVSFQCVLVIKSKSQIRNSAKNEKFMVKVSH